MGLMDKFKNLFTDEEVIEEDEEIEIKEVKKEDKPKLPTFMREKIEKEEKEKKPKITKIEDNDIDEEIKKDIKLESKLENDALDEPKEEKIFKFPIDFSEDDFTETVGSRESLHSKKEESKESFTEEEIEDTIKEPKIPIRPQKKELKVAEIYKDKKEVKKQDDKRFRATPIISPIYGVLDKNYDPEDVENNKGHNLEDARPSKSIDFDSVRKKAYGNLSEEIKENLMCENCEYLKEARERRGIQKEEYERLDDNDEYEDITIDEATENYYDYGVEYEKKTPETSELDKKYYLDEDDVIDVKITNSNDEEETRKNEIPPVKSSINLLSTLKKGAGDEQPEEEPKKEKNLELTDDLFNLIDSMYDERNDDE